MKPASEKLLRAALWLAAILLAARLAAVIAGAFMPPLPTLECRQKSLLPKARYPFAEAFGLRSVSKRPSAPQKTPSRPPRTLTGYRLTMTAVGDPGMAIIVHNGKSRLLEVGESIDGFRLTEVMTDRVKLVKNGREYWLTMEKSKSPTIKATGAASSARGGDFAEQIRKEGDTYYVPRELLSQMHDLKKIFKLISIRPIYRDKRLTGFGVTRVKKGSVFDKMGLRKRDVIQKIDGKPITSEAEAFKYFNRIDELNSMTLTIKRGHMTKELRYEIF